MISTLEHVIEEESQIVEHGYTLGAFKSAGSRLRRKQRLGW